jgi:wobble nucleotide-excising tRNase
MIGEIVINPPVATYQSQARLNDLRRINFIFGANGTGKTTISRVIDQVEGHNHCFLNWQNAAPLQPMVYNRDFVDNNFNQQNPVQGVFTLGDNQVEAEREIARLQPELEKLTGQINSLTTQLNGEDGESGKYKELNDLEPVLKENCWKKKQLYDEYFQDAFSGVRNNAEKFKAKVQTEKASNNANLLTVESLKEKAKTIFAGDIVRVSSLENLSAELLTTAELHPLLLKPIVGNQDVDIAALIEKLGNSDWIKQGRIYHEQSNGTCPFCQQQTDEQFANSLDSFFSEAYDNDNFV